VRSPGAASDDDDDNVDDIDDVDEAEGCDSVGTARLDSRDAPLAERDMVLKLEA
jgi:hypothetical protein